MPILPRASSGFSYHRTHDPMMTAHDTSPRPPCRAASSAAPREGRIVRYLGIPYAQAPFGENRFRAPRPALAWEGVRDATRFGPTPPQVPYAGAIGELLGSVRIDGDDILTANVWAPSDASGAPVLLWIHGGALERGTAALPLYDGTVFATAGIVFVSINYRLGSEGFSVLEGAPRNLGLRDAAAALEWVHREISAFGGDPARITAMGESAGGAIVAGLLARDSSRELISRAIIESGPLQAQTARKAGRVTAQLAKRLGVRSGPRVLRGANTRAAPGSAEGAGRGVVAARRSTGLPVRDRPRQPSPVAARGSRRDRHSSTHRQQHRRVSALVPPETLAGISEFKMQAARIVSRIPRRAVRRVPLGLPRSDHRRDLRAARHRHDAAGAPESGGGRSPRRDARLRVRMAESGPRPACGPRAGTRLRVRPA